MAGKDLMMCLFLLNEIILTNSQVINHQQDRCDSKIENDLLLKISEFQFEFSSYRDQAMKTERLLWDRLSKLEHDERGLQDQITQLKEDFAKYKNGPMDNQTAMSGGFESQGNEFIGNFFFIKHLLHFLIPFTIPGHPGSR